MYDTDLQFFAVKIRLSVLKLFQGVETYLRGHNLLSRLFS